MDEMPPDSYDGWTVKQVEEHLDSSNYSYQQLRDLVEYEISHDDRLGVQRAIGELTTDYEVVETSDEDSNEKSIDETAESSSESLSTVSENSQDLSSTINDFDGRRLDQEMTEVSNELQEVMVSIDDPTRVSVAGLVFSKPHKIKTVDYNERVKEAVERGHLVLHTEI